MNSSLTYYFAAARTADLLHDARQACLARATRGNRTSRRRWRTRLASDPLARVATQRTVPIPQCQEL
jgi:hypothetical protein